MGLRSLMRKVLAGVERVEASADEDGVHQCRVALRRCRTMALLFEAVNGEPGWSELRKDTKPLFHALGDLRDVHVVTGNIARLSPGNDLARAPLVAALGRREAKASRRVRRALERFDRKRWKALSRQLRAPARRIAKDRKMAHQLVLELWSAVQRRHRAAMKRRGRRQWHQLRIAVKRLRYGVESLLPAGRTRWQHGLREIQDLLGDVHDLDLTDRFIEDASSDTAVEGVEVLRRAIAAERRRTLAVYRARMSGPAGLLRVWERELSVSSTSSGWKALSSKRTSSTTTSR